MTKSILVLGPPLCGKEETCRTLLGEYRSMIRPIKVGDMVRERIKTDEGFRNLMSRLGPGALVPDDEVVSMTKPAYDKAAQDGVQAVYWDGFGRTGEQISLMNGWGALTPDQSHSLVIIIDVSLDVCKRRLQSDIATGARRGREDNSDLVERYHVYQNHLPYIKSKLLHRGIRWVDMRGDIGREQQNQHILDLSRILRIRRIDPSGQPAFSGSGLAERLVG